MKKRRDFGLYRKVVADRLRKGITALETCQVEKNAWSELHIKTLCYLKNGQEGN